MGPILRQSYASSTFVTSSVPDFTSKQYIVALCSVPQEYCSPSSLAFYVAQFTALKYLLYSRLSEDQQSWISASDPRGLWELSFGGKDVLEAFSHNIIVKKDVRDAIAMFKRRAKLAADAIRDGNPEYQELVLIICGPTSIQQDIVTSLPCPIDAEQLPEFIRLGDIKTLVGDNVNYTLITPNMLSVGWVINTAYNNVATASGSANSAHILRVAHNTKPLLMERVFDRLLEQLGHMQSWESFKGPDGLKEATKERPNSCLQALRESLYRLYAPAPGPMGFNFDEALDNWSRLLAQRRGFSLASHESRWSRLPPCTEPTEPEMGLSGHSAFGLSRDSYLMHLNVLAFTQRDKWTMDEEDYDNPKLQALLQTPFRDMRNPSNPNSQHSYFACRALLDVLAYRLAAVNLADAIADMQSRVSPTYGECLYSQDAWLFAHVFRFEKHNPKFRDALCKFINGMFPPLTFPWLTSDAHHSVPAPYGHHTEKFRRPIAYIWNMAAGYEEQRCSETLKREPIQRYIDIRPELVEVLCNEADEDPHIRDAICNLSASLGNYAELEPTQFLTQYSTPEAAGMGTNESCIPESSGYQSPRNHVVTLGSQPSASQAQNRDETLENTKIKSGIPKDNLEECIHIVTTSKLDSLVQAEEAGQPVEPDHGVDESDILKKALEVPESLASGKLLPKNRGANTDWFRCIDPFLQTGYKSKDGDILNKNEDESSAKSTRETGSQAEDDEETSLLLSYDEIKPAVSVAPKSWGNPLGREFAAWEEMSGGKTYKTNTWDLLAKTLTSNCDGPASRIEDQVKHNITHSSGLRADAAPFRPGDTAWPQPGLQDSS